MHAIKKSWKFFGTITAICLLSSFSSLAFNDTTFIGKSKAIVEFRDTGYDNFVRKIYLEKKSQGWKESADSVFYNDGKVFRARSYYQAAVPISIDTFFLSPDATATTPVNAIAINVGALGFIQSMDAFGNVKKIMVRNLKRDLPSFEIDVTVEHPEVDRPQLFIALDSVTKRITKIQFHFLFNSLYFWENKQRVPATLMFPADKPPYFL